MKEGSSSHYAGVNLYTIHDKRAGQYRAPFAMMSDGEAVRAFMDLLEDKDSLVGKHPRDFALIKVGTWYQDDAVFATLSGGVLETLVDGARLGSSALEFGPAGSELDEKKEVKHEEIV